MIYFKLNGFRSRIHFGPKYNTKMVYDTRSATIGTGEPKRGHVSNSGLCPACKSCNLATHDSMKDLFLRSICILYVKRDKIKKNLYTIRLNIKYSSNQGRTSEHDYVLIDTNKNFSKYFFACKIYAQEGRKESLNKLYNKKILAKFIASTRVTRFASMQIFKFYLLYANFIQT